MKKLAQAIAFALALAGLVDTARAEIGTADNVPAATLLLPYFEVAVNDPNGVNTYLTINNASATAVVAHVQLWTDQSIPTVNFDVYLTGYDMEIIDLGRLFREGRFPRTADAGADPLDNGLPTTGISNHGDLSQDINFPGATGPCTSGTLYSNPALSSMQRNQLQRAHRGKKSSTLGGCASSQYPDQKARGYVTVDVVSQCTVLAPSDAGYFSGGIATAQNVLWGDWNIVDAAQGHLHGSPLVHIESCTPGSSVYTGYVGNGDGAGLCPFVPGDYTFYGRYASVAGQDQREPLGTTFGSRFLNGGGFGDDTDLFVWRDSKSLPTGADGPHPCSSEPSWFPLTQNDVVAFDDAENATNVCALTECFPLGTQRVSVANGATIGADIDPPGTSGWLFMNLNHSGAGPYPNIAQAWVSTAMRANGRFAVGFPAAALDNANETANGGVIILPEP
jgi:hypothetical protein